jgi:hypothetical protein
MREPGGVWVAVMRGILVFGWAVAVPWTARAANLPADALVFDEVAGVRSAAMGGAHRGVGTSNDTIYLNPAGMAIGHRYAVELNYGYVPFSDLSHFNASAVDSKSGPVAGALAYSYTRGENDAVSADLHRVYVGAAYPLSDLLAVGVTVRHIRGDFLDGDTPRTVELYGGDVGVMARLSNLGIGVTAHNVIKEEVQRLMPLSFGVGVSYGIDVLSVAGDLVFNTRSDGLESARVGGEYLLAGAFPLRVGFYHAPFTNRDGVVGSENVLTAGVGWVSPGLGVGLAAQRSFERPRNWNLTASLQFFM